MIAPRLLNASDPLAPAPQIAIAAHRPVCDSLCPALAVGLNSQVITADERWLNWLKAKPFTPFIRFLVA